MILDEAYIKEIDFGPTIDGMFKSIDYAAGLCVGRTKLHDNSKEFVKKLIELKHYRALEFGTVYLNYSQKNIYNITNCLFPSINESTIQLLTFIYIRDLVACKRAYISEKNDNIYCILNFRDYLECCKQYNYSFEYLIKNLEEHWQSDISVFKDVKRKTIQYYCSRGIADEARTHCSLSSLMSSTRYINASKTGDIHFIKPYWYDNANEEIKDVFYSYLTSIEDNYEYFINEGLKPQDAREILPLSLAVNFIQCGFTNIPNYGWENFIKLRCDKAAHPDMQIIANKIKELLK